MEEWLHLLTRDTVVIIDTMALIIVAFGTAEAFFTGLWAAFSPTATRRRVREVWLRYGRWLVAGLTFQLAADIIATAFAPTWEELGQLGAIAAIRTFLNFFLERDLAELRDRDADSDEVSRRAVITVCFCGRDGLGRRGLGLTLE